MDAESARAGAKGVDGDATIITEQVCDSRSPTVKFVPVFDSRVVGTRAEAPRDQEYMIRV